MISGSVFSTLNEAWDKFKKDNGLWATTWSSIPESRTFSNYRLLAFGQMLAKQICINYAQYIVYALKCSFRNIVCSRLENVVAFVLSFIMSTLHGFSSNRNSYSRDRLPVCKGPSPVTTKMHNTFRKQEASTESGEIVRSPWERL